MPDERQPSTPPAAALPWEADFARRLRELRERKGWSQAAVAEKLAVSYGIKIDASAIARIEKNAHSSTGARLIRLGEAVAISKVLDVPLDSMLHAGPPLSEQLANAQKRLDHAMRAADAAHMNAQRAIIETEIARGEVLKLQEQITRENRVQLLRTRHSEVRKLLLECEAEMHTLTFRLHEATERLHAGNIEDDGEIRELTARRTAVTASRDTIMEEEHAIAAELAQLEDAAIESSTSDSDEEVASLSRALAETRTRKAMTTSHAKSRRLAEEIQTLEQKIHEARTRHRE